MFPEKGFYRTRECAEAWNIIIIVIQMSAPLTKVSILTKNS